MGCKRIVFLNRDIGHTRGKRRVLLHIGILFPIHKRRSVFPFLRVRSLIGVTKLCFYRIPVRGFDRKQANCMYAFFHRTQDIRMSTNVLQVTRIRVKGSIRGATIDLLERTLIGTTITDLRVRSKSVRTFHTCRTRTKIHISRRRRNVQLRLRRRFVTNISGVTRHNARIVTSNVRVRVKIFRLRIARRSAIRIVIMVLTNINRGAIGVATTFISSDHRTSSFQANTRCGRGFRSTILLGPSLQVVRFRVRLFLCSLAHFELFRGGYPSIPNQGAHYAA